MLIQFTKHALERIKARQIEKKEIILTLNNPEKTIKTKSDSYIAQKKFGEKLLRVIYKKVGKNIIIITAYKASDFDRYI